MLDSLIITIMRHSGIYLIKNTINGKVYVGSTSNLYRRLRFDHYGSLKQGRHKNPHLQASWDKYGEQYFEFSVLELTEECPIILLEREKYYLDLFKSFISEFGYNKNMIPNSSIGLKRSKETKEKISKSSLGRPSWIKGKKTPIEVKNKQKKSHIIFMKQIERICPITGLIKEYQSLKEAEKDGFHRYHIGRCCRGIIDMHKNFYWNYI